MLHLQRNPAHSAYIAAWTAAPQNARQPRPQPPTGVVPMWKCTGFLLVLFSYVARRLSRTSSAAGTTHA